MGKIFGLCDNPVSIPTSPFEPILPQPEYREIYNPALFSQPADKFVYSSKAANKKGARVTKFLNRLIKASLKR